MEANKATLSQLRGQFHLSGIWTSNVKNLVNVDQFVDLSISIGVTLAFRWLLHTAMGKIMASRRPIIFDTVQQLKDLGDMMGASASEQDKQFQSLAMDLGVPFGCSDPLLVQALSKYVSRGEPDHALWSFLPEMFGLSYLGAAWKGATYDVHGEGFSNNVHTTVFTESALIDVFTRLAKPSAPAAESNADVSAMMARFLECSSLTLLYCQGESAGKNHAVPSCCVIVLEQFVQQNAHR